MQKEILTTEEVAALLHISERTIRDSLNSGELKGYKRFNRWYVLYEDVLEFIKTAPTKED